MNIYVFTKKDTPIKKVFPKNVNYIALSLVIDHLPHDACFYYFDISGLTDKEQKKLISQIKTFCNDTPWGIIDPKGSCKDPLVFLIDGASDYIGKNFFTESIKIDLKRIKAAHDWREDSFNVKRASQEVSGKEKKSDNCGKVSVSIITKTGAKFPPANIFLGWKKITAGKSMPFFLLHCSLHGKISLETRFDEKALAQIHKRFVSCLKTYLKDADCLLWMDSDKDCLFLFPPKLKNAQSIIEACIRLIICTPMITMETLAISVPVDFVMALHYGSLNYKPPGKTDNVVSDAINAVFHLGAKKADPGRLTITGEVPDGTIPSCLEDCFINAGFFEGRKIYQTKKFNYEKPWVS